MRTVGLTAAWIMIACCVALGQPAPEPPSATMPAEAISIPENRWVRVADAAADPLGREIEPGRGAYWCYAPSIGQFLRFGGFTPTEDNSMWAFDLAERKWDNPLKADYSWPLPTDRPGAGAWWSMAYDSSRKVIWLQGGYGLASRLHGELYRDIWKYDPEAKTFTAMKSKNPPMPTFYAMDGARIVYDSRNDLIIRAPAYRQEWAYRSNSNRTWVYDPKTNEWAGRDTPDMPGGRTVLAGAFVYDASAGKCVYMESGDDGTSATWTYDGAANVWQKLNCKVSPPGRVCAGAAYDSGNKRVIIYGGVSGPPEGKGNGYLYRGGGVQLHDTWALDTANSQWAQLQVGSPALDRLPDEEGQFPTGRKELVQAMDYDSRLGAVVVSAPTLGVWALRYRPAAAEPLAELKLPALAAPAKPARPERVFPQSPANKKLLDLEPNTWVKLGGGGKAGGDEVPWTWDEETGYLLKFGGCGNIATTFASGYCQDLTAYDPASERWIALRWADPTGPPRPGLGCTRWYAYDPFNKVTWFQGANSPARSPYTLPRGAEDVPGMFCYSGLQDRFDYLPSTGGRYGGNNQGSGIAGGFDRANRMFVIFSRTYGSFTKGFSPDRMTWETLQAKVPPTGNYVGATYVDSMRAIFAPCQPPEGGTVAMAFDAAARQWRELGPKGDTPPALRLPVAAYDPDHDIVLVAGQPMAADPAGKPGEPAAWVYLVKENAWKKLAPTTPTPRVAWGMVFDRRHKVFIAPAGDVYAYRYKAPQ